MKIARDFFILFIFCLSFKALANDGLAGVKAGKVELNFHSNTAVQMKSEILKISSNQIEVEYVFSNTSKKDEQVLVAFPFPAIDCADFRFDYDNHFKAAVNGQAIKVNEEIVITFKGRNVSKEVQRLGVRPCRDKVFEDQVFGRIHYNVPNPKEYKFSKKMNESITYYSNDGELFKKFFELMKLGYGPEDTSYPWGPQWKVSKKSYFTVTFPALKETKISHSYMPWPGGGSYVPSNLRGVDVKNLKRRPVWKQGLSQKNPDVQRFEMKQLGEDFYVEYILKTANTWKGPIENFKLILVRGTHFVFSNYVKDFRLYGNDLVWETRGFRPQMDLVVGFHTFRFYEKEFNKSVSESEALEFKALEKEYDSLKDAGQEAKMGLALKFKAYIEKYEESKNLPQAFSMLDDLQGKYD